MYSGTLATLSRDVPYSIVFFPLYANIKAAFADKKTGVNSMTSVLFSGMIAGAVAAGIVTPTDVVKTRSDQTLSLLFTFIFYSNFLFLFVVP